MKVQSFFLMLPCVAGFFWFIAYFLFAPRNAMFRKSRRFIGVVSLFFLFAILSSDESSRLLVHFTLFEQVCALLLIPCFLSYIKECQGAASSNLFYRFLCILPFLHLTVGIETVYTAGYDNALKILIDSYTFHGPMFPFLGDKGQVVFYACYTYMFKTFLFLDFIYFSVGLMKCAISRKCSIKDIWSFLFRGAKVIIVPVQYLLSLLFFMVIFVALVLGRGCYVDNILLAAFGCLFLTVLFSMIAFVGAADGAGRHSISDISGALRFGGAPICDDRSPGFVPDEEFVKTEPVVPVPPVESLSEDGRLQLVRKDLDDKLDKLVVGEGLFLKRDLTIVSVSDRLGVFKEELADYIDYKYGMSFQNYINKLRVNYAEQYILAHDGVTQKEIAVACGFSGASTFNSSFTRFNGVTPKIWKDRHSGAAGKDVS